LQQLNDPLYVSSDLRSPEAANFLTATSSFDVIANAITALVAPQLYDPGLVAIQLVKDGQHLHRSHPNIHLWSSVYSGFAIIVNRLTPPHRDTSGSPMDYDLLVSGGTHKECVLDVHDLGMTLSYLPGTAIAITGKVLRHGVKTWDGGERICQARFVKDAVRDRQGLPRPDWVNYNDYICLTGKK
jgi:hypothetical protein